MPSSYSNPLGALNTSSNTTRTTTAAMTTTTTITTLDIGTDVHLPLKACPRRRRRRIHEPFTIYESPSAATDTADNVDPAMSVSTYYDSSFSVPPEQKGFRFRVRNPPARDVDPQYRLPGGLYLHPTGEIWNPSAEDFKNSDFSKGTHIPTDDPHRRYFYHFAKANISHRQCHPATVFWAVAWFRHHYLKQMLDNSPGGFPASARRPYRDLDAMICQALDAAITPEDRARLAGPCEARWNLGRERQMEIFEVTLHATLYKHSGHYALRYLSALTRRMQQLRLDADYQLKAMLRLIKLRFDPHGESVRTVVVDIEATMEHIQLLDPLRVLDLAPAHAARLPDLRLRDLWSEYIKKGWETYRRLEAGLRIWYDMQILPLVEVNVSEDDNRQTRAEFTAEAMDAVADEDEGL